MAHPGGRMTEEDEAFEDLAKRQDYWGMQGSRKHQILRFTENVESKVTSMTDKEALKKMYQLLLTEPHAPPVCAQLERIAREALTQPEKKMVMWPCLIDTADFSKGTVTVVMQCNDYKVSAGTHWLSTTPPKENI